MKRVVPLLFLTIISPGAIAEIYKWLDRNGNTVYSQSPPPAGASPLTTPGVSSSSPDNGTTSKAVEEILNSDREAREKRRALQQQKRAHKAEEERHKQLRQSCERLRNNLATMKSKGGRRIYVEESGGKNRILSESELSKKMLDAEQKIQKYCTE